MSGGIHGLTFVTFVTSQLLNEIMPMIYKRFTEKTAEEWRQIYKVCDEYRSSFLFEVIRLECI